MCHTTAVDSAKPESAGAPEDEIEITPEMIEAGADAIGLYEPGDCELAAFSCFKAMVAVSRSLHNEDMPQRNGDQ